MDDAVEFDVELTELIIQNEVSLELIRNVGFIILRLISWVLTFDITVHRASKIPKKNGNKHISKHVSKSKHVFDQEHQ